MPDEIHKRLDKRAREMGLDPDSDAYKKYVYGTLAKIERAKRLKKMTQDIIDGKIDEKTLSD